MPGSWLLLVALAAPPAEPEPAGEPYTGAFRAVQLGAGPVIADGVGLGFSVGVRASSVIHLADLELEYRLTSLPDEGLTQHQLALAGQLHPLFLFLLTNNRWGATLASLFVRLAIGPTYTSVGHREEFEVAWDWGVGLDVPLTSPDDGTSFWLGGLFTRSCVIGEDPFEQGTSSFVLLRLGYRLNGL